MKTSLYDIYGFSFIQSWLRGNDIMHDWSTAFARAERGYQQYVDKDLHGVISHMKLFKIGMISCCII